MIKLYKPKRWNYMFPKKSFICVRKENQAKRSEFLNMKFPSWDKNKLQ